MFGGDFDEIPSDEGENQEDGEPSAPKVTGLQASHDGLSELIELRTPEERPASTQPLADRVRTSVVLEEDEDDMASLDQSRSANGFDDDGMLS